MRENDDPRYEEFETGLVKLYFDVFGETLTQWVMPTVALTPDMEIVEDSMVPDGQLIQNTMGLITWADAQLKASIAQRRFGE